MTQVESSNQEQSQEQKKPQMRSVEYYKELTPEQQLEMLKKAKGGTWYDGWQPYCGVCSIILRMKKKDYGFQCSCCNNMIGFDLTRVIESPLNKKTAKVGE